MFLGLGAIVRNLDAAGLTAAADLHLRLDNTGVSDFVRRVDRFVHRAGRATGRHGHAMAREQLFSLIFE